MIDIRNLSKDYGATRALDGVSFTVGRGEILGLLGPNGAGKTTTMRILTGYIGPTAGSVRVNDLDVTEQPLAAKRQIGYLPEFAPLYADMLVADYLQYVAAIRNVAKTQRLSRIADLVDQCGLRDVAHRPFRELSRGYKQRVGLAHALMSDPDILVLDEPTAGLDPNQIVEIRRIIREAGREKTVILSTHILTEAESTCDRIVIINRGRVVADGTAKEVKAAALSGMVIRLGLAGTSFADAQASLLTLVAVREVRQVDDRAEPGEIWLDVSCNTDARREIYLAIKSRDWILTELRASGQSLEDTFRELTATAADGGDGESTVDGAE